MRELSGNESTRRRSWNRGQLEKAPSTSTHLRSAYRPKIQPEIREVQTKTDPTSPKNDWISKVLKASNSAPAKMLNELSQSYSDIERGIFVSIPDSECVEQSVDIGSLDYITSSEPVKKWEAGFAYIGQQYLQGASTPDVFEATLAGILAGVERLEAAKERLEDSLEDELRKCGINDVVPDSFWHSIEERCTSLEAAFISLELKLDEQAGH